MNMHQFLKKKWFIEASCFKEYKNIHSLVPRHDDLQFLPEINIKHELYIWSFLCWKKYLPKELMNGSLFNFMLNPLKLWKRTHDEPLSSFWWTGHGAAEASGTVEAGEFGLPQAHGSPGAHVHGPGGPSLCPAAELGNNFAAWLSLGNVMHFLSTCNRVGIVDASRWMNPPLSSEGNAGQWQEPQKSKFLAHFGTTWIVFILAGEPGRSVIFFMLGHVRSVELWEFPPCCC